MSSYCLKRKDVFSKIHNKGIDIQIPLEEEKGWTVSGWVRLFKGVLQILY